MGQLTQLKCCKRRTQALLEGQAGNMRRCLLCENTMGVHGAHPSSLLITGVGILTRKALNMEELVIHISVNLSRHRSMLCCAPHAGCTLLQAMSWCTNPLASQWAQPAQAEEPAGSFHLALVIIPPAWPCRYLQVQQEDLVQTSLLFDHGNAE